MTRDEINYIIGKAIVRCIGYLVLFLAGCATVMLLNKYAPRATASDNVMTVERAEKECRKEGFKNWIREDFRWGKHKVQCFNKQWKLKEIVIK